MQLRSSSADRDHLPIDIWAGFCPNRIDTAKLRRLSHASDASRHQREAEQDNRLMVAGSVELVPDRAQGVTVPKCVLDPGAFQTMVRSSELLTPIRRGLGTGSEGRHDRRAAASGGIYGDC